MKWSGIRQGLAWELKYECDSGYTLLAGNLHLICQSDGQWSGHAPKCHNTGINTNPMEGQSGQKEHFLILINDFSILINDFLISINHAIS